ncbi:MAG: hypothetical protein ACTSRS_18915 [Candidatus Helarchaeota archaeon]
MSEKRVKQILKRLLSKKLGRKLREAQADDIILNAYYERYQLIKTLRDVCGLENNKFINSALTNLRNRGLNRALANASEITQLGAFLEDLIADAGGGIVGGDDEYE